MVLGLRSKNRRPASVQADYTIHIQEIKPWPPSQSLKSLKSVVFQWENGSKSSGSISPVAPSQTKIEFNESFNVNATLVKESSGKGNGFQKNVLELSLYEQRKDKSVKGQLLGNAVIDLGQYGNLKESVSLGVPLSCKRSYRNTAQPVVYFRIQPLDRERGSSSASSSFRESLSKEVSLDRDGRESSVSGLMSEEYEEEEAEIASFTDDDVSSHSSLGNLVSSGPEATQSGLEEQGHLENEPDVEKENKGEAILPQEPVCEKSETEPVATLPVTNGTVQPDNGLFHLLPGELSADTEANGESSPQAGHKNQAHVENEPDTKIEDNRTTNLASELVPIEPELETSIQVLVSNDTGINQRNSMSPSLPEDLTMDYCDTTLSNSLAKSDAPTTHSPPSLAISDVVLGGDLQQDISENLVTFRDEENITEETQISFDKQIEALKPVNASEPELSNDDKRLLESRNDSDGSTSSHDIGTHDDVVEESIVELKGPNDLREKMEVVGNCSIEIESSADSSPDNGSIASRESLEHTNVVRHKYLQNALRKPLNSDMRITSQRIIREKGNGILTGDRLKNRRFSMRSPPHLLGSLKYPTSDQYEEDMKEVDVSEEVCNVGVKYSSLCRRDDQESITLSLSKIKNASRGNINNVPNRKVQEMEVRIGMLEAELREAAAIEISVFSIVAEHGGSVQKVHTPARRLSRLYMHASKHWSQERTGSAARSAVSGLVLAAKACGNDVPRLTFWLSNTIVLRAILIQAFGRSDGFNDNSIRWSLNGSRLMAVGNSSPLKWESYRRKKESLSFTKEVDEWEDLSTFIDALERIESWMFSRVIESIWWQTLTPHMQPMSEGGEPKKNSSKKKDFGREASFGSRKHENISIDIWKKAFSDACERLCPVRAEGHECGCLPMLARLAMEQCVARLDVAMFNAILRESEDEIPTDPVSDPISDPKVLPIPPGKSSFGAGAQLKNAIGNWSRWLTDLFGMDMEESPQDKNEQYDDRLDVVETFKTFRLLNALSDLLMLPKDMLLEKSIRKEVCPTFSSSIIKRILGSFLPDEFCPDEIPSEVIAALDSEDSLESKEEEIRNYPCNASPTLYTPPSLASINAIIGDVRSISVLRRSGSSVVRKCHTSDDELDELDSPLTSLMLDNSTTSTAHLKGNTSADVVRYQLLREVWRNSH